MKKNFFPAKVLLFGEYAVLSGGKALAFPFPRYGGYLYIPKKETQNSNRSNKSLKEFVKHLKTNAVGQLLNLNFEIIDDELKRGLCFHSSIAEKFGIGSSGGLIASFYDRFIKPRPLDFNDWTGSRINKLRTDLSLLENVFHETSSGIDPLVSYIQLPIVHQHQSSKILESTSNNDVCIFLLKTHQAAKTKVGVHQFKGLIDANAFKNEFIFTSDRCIDLILKGDKIELFEHLKKLSVTTMDWFRYLIPENLIPVWKEGIDSDDYYLKLCGSGGGGFILGFTENWSRINGLKANYPIEVVSLI